MTVPRGATHAWIRVHVQIFADEGEAAPVGLRCYGFNRPPSYDEGHPAFELDHAGELVELDHGALGLGEWIELGLLELAPYLDDDRPDFDETLHLCLAYAIDPVGASEQAKATRVIFKAWNVRPVFDPPFAGVKL